MSNRFMKNKITFGLVTMLAAGMSCAMAADKGAAKEGASKQDETVLNPAGKFLFGKDKKEVEAERLLDEGEPRRTMLHSLAEVRHRLGGPGAAERAARLVASLLEEEPGRN